MVMGRREGEREQEQMQGEKGRARRMEAESCGGGGSGGGSGRQTGCVSASTRPDVHAPRRRTALRASGALLIGLVALSSLRMGACVPLGWRDLEDGDSVPPAHLPTKNIDLSKPLPLVDGSGLDGYAEDDFGDAPNQEAPPHSRGGRGSVPGRARAETLREEGGGNPGEAGGAEDFVATSVWSVAFNTILMAVASGFGAAPFFIVSHVNRKWLGIANALASGVMLAASFGLIAEGLEGVKSQPHTLVRLMGGMILGLVFIIVSQVCPQIPSDASGSCFGLCARAPADADECAVY